MIFRKKMALLELVACLIIPISSFAMSESEQERLERASTSRQVPVVDLYDQQGHHGAASSDATFHDEIVFFNVGQGHAALINKIGHVPLLVDAGSNSRPYTTGETYEWTKFEKSTLLSQISKKILGYWGNSHPESLRGRDCHLNIIVTHPDQDHKDFVPAILSNLISASQDKQFRFYPHALLGGTEAHYSKYFLPDCDGGFTSSYLGLFLKGSLGSLESSGCITHLFCPYGYDPKQNNSWSVVVRLEIEGISAMLTGDADTYVKSQMLQALGGNGESLASDILLAPHHGSDEHTYFPAWDQYVNPKAIIIGAAPNKGQKGNRHPRGETIYKLLNFPEGRIWKDKVERHGLLYHCGETTHGKIGQTLETKNRLFDVAPRPPEVESEGGEQWHLVWTNAPIYTLWTTGTIVFKEDVRTPELIDAPHGLMGYIAVPDPSYLFDSSLRSQLIPPSEKERRVIYATIPDLFREKIGVGRPSDKEDASLLTDLAVNEFRRILDLTDREFYLSALKEMFREKKLVGVWSRRMSSFKWLREAIVERSQRTVENEARLKKAVNFLLSDFARREFMEWDFEGTTLILKAFLKSHRPLQQLEKYVTTLSVIHRGVSPEEVEVLCPSGFLEWLQLEKLVSFVTEEIITPSGEPISVGDVVDILLLRLEGKNFKEIGRVLVEEEGFVDLTQREAIDSLQQFVTSLRETIPTSAEGRISIARVMDMRQQGKSFHEIRQAIVDSEGFHEDLQQLNEIWAAMHSSPIVPYFPLTPENFVPFDGHPTTLEECYDKLEEYFPRAMDEYLS